ncbi:MAG: alpha/beta fold hydrolase [Acidimicrobiales bacterium]
MTITAPRYEGRVAVRDDRYLGIAEFGPPSSEQTIVWFHGTPGARRQVPEAARRIARERHVRILGMDRPGVGLSTPHLYDQLVDFTADLELALERLGVGYFATVGLSGGAPYALAAAYAFPERVPRVGILGGVVPSGGDEGTGGGLVSLATRFKPLLPLISEPVGSLLTSFVRLARPIASPALDLYARFAPPGDQMVLRDPEIKEMFLDDILNSGRHGMRAAAYDAILFTRYWGFDVRDIRVPVTWWQGDEDNLVPLSHAEHIVPLIPGAELRIRPGDGHLGGLGIAAEVCDTVLDW